MTNELTVLGALKSVLIANVNQYLQEGWTQLANKNVIMEWPEVEGMTDDVTVFINGNYGELRGTPELIWLPRCTRILTAYIRPSERAWT